jgi:hypothetical protein
VKFLKTLQNLWDRMPDGVKRVFHTGWVTFVAVMLAGLIPILEQLLEDLDLAAATSALGALTLAALIAAGTAMRVYLASLMAKRK